MDDAAIYNGGDRIPWVTQKRTQQSLSIPSDLIYGAYNICSTLVRSNGGEVKGGWGTGFGVQIGPMLVMPTARHVVDPSFLDPKYVGAKLVELEVQGRHLHDGGVPTGYFSSTLDRFGVCWPNDGVSDVAVVYGLKAKNDVPFQIHSYGLEHIPDVSTLNMLTVGAPIGAIGYPEHHDHVDLRPLLRAGHISSDPRYPLAIARHGGPQRHFGHIVAYDGFSWGGLSGAPVFWHHDDHRQPFLVGVNAGHMETQVEANVRSHSGLSYFYRGDVLFRLLNTLLLGKGWMSPLKMFGTAAGCMLMEVGGPTPFPLQEVKLSQTGDAEIDPGLGSGAT